MKKLILSSVLLVNTLAFAQVGINTPNPLGSFHVDGAKDDPATGNPTAAQQANDFVTTATGNVGIGTISPETKLDIVTPGDAYGFQHTNGTIQLRTYVGKGTTNDQTDAGWIGTDSQHPLDLMTAKTAKMRITTEGNVGISTSAPASTLDINAKSSNGTSTDVDGILIPRVDRQRAQSMTSVPVSTMVYVNNISTGSQTGTAVNINQTGFYYYDGSVWKKMEGESVENKIFAVATKTARQTLPSGGGRDITWQAVNGNNASQITVSGSTVTLPANRAFLVSGFLAWVSSPVAIEKAWIKYKFVNASNSDIGVVNIPGFSEGSTEEYNDGGVNPATAVIFTGASPVQIKLRTVGSGGSGSYELSYGAGNTGTSYITIQQL